LVTDRKFINLDSAICSTDRFVYKLYGKKQKELDFNENNYVIIERVAIKNSLSIETCI